MLIGGELVGRDDPRLAAGRNVIDVTCDLAQAPEWQDIMITKSPYIDRRITRFSHLCRDPHDLLQWQKLIRALCRRCGGCIQRCGGHDALSALAIVTAEAEKETAIDYHKRFLRYLAFIQREDLDISCAHMDSRGDRMKKLSEQENPDQYVHVCEKRDGGIIVSGRKTAAIQAAHADEIAVLSSCSLDEDDRDYGLAFAIPADWEGITLITKPSGLHDEGFDTFPFLKYGVSHSIVVFNNVYIPDERVFLCGEWRFSERLASLFRIFHLFNHSGCKLALSEILCGTASLASEVNNTEHIPSIRRKIASSIEGAILAHAAGVAAALFGTKTICDLFVPNMEYIKSAKKFTETLIASEFGLLNNISDNFPESLPLTQDFYGKETKELLRKFIKRNPSIPPELSLKMWKYIESVGKSSCFCTIAGEDMHIPELSSTGISDTMPFAGYDDSKTLARYLAGVDESLDDEKIRKGGPTLGLSLTTL